MLIGNGKIKKMIKNGDDNLTDYIKEYIIII